MRFIIFILCLGCFVGCASTQQINDGSIPQVLLQSQLPKLPVSINQPIFDLDVVLFVLEDGTVGKARMIHGSGDAGWDSLALSSLKQWRFVPARNENQSISTWVHVKTPLRFAEPQYMNLAEILCTTSEEADTVYDAIKQGKNFNELAMQYSVDPSREMSGMLGNVNINMYPENIRKFLGKLDINDYTKPIKYGDLYAIFKRLEK